MCPLCERDVALTKHHVKLKRRDKHDKVLACADCQSVIHGLYPGTELARRPDLWTIEGLRADPAIAKALTFVRKVQPGAMVRTKQRRRR